MARAYGHSLAGSVNLVCEVFPKGPGLNGVKAPGSRHPKDGRVYPLFNLYSGCPEMQFEEAIRCIQPTELAQPTHAPPAVEPPGITREFERRDPFSGLYHLDVPSRDQQHADLVAEVTKYTAMRYIGPERLRGKCPFHDDQHPSFGIDRYKWECFAKCLGEDRSYGGLAAFKARMRERGR